MPSSKFETTVGDITLTELRDAAEERHTPMPTKGNVTRVNGQNIVTVDLDKAHYVQSFKPSKLKDTKGLRYSEVAKTFSDPEGRKNTRFAVSELAKRALSVEQEEEQRIELEVQRRVEEKNAELKKQVMEQAYAEGFAAGKNDARTEILTSAKPIVDSLERTIKSFEGMRFEIFKANEELLIQMVYQLARSIVLRELKEDHEYTKRLITHLLERVGARENIKVYIGEKAFSSAEVLKQDLVQYFGELKNISVEVDSEIKDQGCSIETDFGEIDARIEVQLANLAEAFGASVGPKIDTEA